MLTEQGDSMRSVLSLGDLWEEYFRQESIKCKGQMMTSFGHAEFEVTFVYLKGDR